MKIHLLLSRAPWHLIATLLLTSATAVSAQGNAVKGQYLANAAGCIGCHTVTKAGATPYAGGRYFDMVPWPRQLAATQ